MTDGSGAPFSTDPHRCGEDVDVIVVTEHRLRRENAEQQCNKSAKTGDKVAAADAHQRARQ